MKRYPKIESVTALAGKKIRVVFENGCIRIYDCRPLLKEEPFKALQDEAFFRSVRAESNGYAVVWNDEVDLSESEIWLHGIIVHVRETLEDCDDLRELRKTKAASRGKKPIPLAIAIKQLAGSRTKRKLTPAH